MGALGLLGSLVGARGGSMVGRMLFGRAGGMVGGLVGSMLGGRGGGAMRGGGGGLGSMLGGLGGMFGGDDEKAEVPADMTEDQAAILIRAMVNAAKADGRVDKSEIDAILKNLGEIDDEDEAFLRAELDRPLNLEEFLAEVPQGMGDQVYAVSLLAIDVDTINEEHYLKQLAEGLGVSADKVNELHDELKIARIF